MAAIRFGTHPGEQYRTITANRHGDRIATFISRTVTVWAVCRSLEAVKLWTVAAPCAEGAQETPFAVRVCVFGREFEDTVYVTVQEGTGEEHISIWRVTNLGWKHIYNASDGNYDISLCPGRRGMYVAQPRPPCAISFVPYGGLEVTHRSHVKVTDTTPYLGSTCVLDAKTSTFLWVSVDPTMTALRFVRTSFSGDIVASASISTMDLLTSGSCVTAPRHDADLRNVFVRCAGCWPTAGGFECFMFATVPTYMHPNRAVSKVLVLSSSLEVFEWKEPWVTSAPAYQTLASSVYPKARPDVVSASESWVVHVDPDSFFWNRGIIVSPDAVRMASMSPHRVGWMIGVVRGVCRRARR